MDLVLDNDNNQGSMKEIEVCPASGWRQPLKSGS